MWCWETAISGAAGTSCSIKHRRQIICSKIKATKPRHSNKFTINFYHCEKKFVRSSEIKKKKMRRHHSPGYVPTQYLHHWRIYSYISILSHNQVSFLKVSWAEFRCYIPHTLVYILQNCPFPTRICQSCWYITQKSLNLPIGWLEIARFTWSKGLVSYIARINRKVQEGRVWRALW